MHESPNVEKFKGETQIVPGLVTILVGENPASQSYVRAKQKTAHDLGFHSIQENQPADMTEADLLKLVEKYSGEWIRPVDLLWQP